MNKDQIQYYSERAQTYENIYQKPERQVDLQTLSGLLKNHFSGKTVFEIACGTGYWTQSISETAQSILATDVNETVLEIAKSKKYAVPVKFELADLYHLPRGNENFEAGFGGFIWSHLPKQQFQDFLSSFTSKIQPGGSVVFTDNNYVAGSSTPIASKDEAGNTYQIRTLADGSLHKIMKNFPTDEEMMELLHPFCEEVHINRLEYFWLLTCKTIKHKA